MSKGTIFKADGFSPKNFTFSGVKENKYGGHYAPVNCDKHNIRIETPKMYVPWGISGYPKEDPQSWSVNLQFPKEMTDRMQRFHDLIDETEQVVVNTAVERSQEWLGRKELKENLAREYFSTWMYRKLNAEGVPSGEYPDQLPLKLKRSNGKFTVKCFGPDKQQANPEDVITKGCYIKAIIEINPVYLKKNSFSLSATALQVRVYPGASRLTGYSFLPDEDDDEVIVLGNLDEAARNIDTSKSLTVDNGSDEESNHDESDQANEANVETQVDNTPEDEDNTNVSPVVEAETVNSDEEPTSNQVNANSDEASSPEPVKKGKKFSKKK